MVVHFFDDQDAAQNALMPFQLSSVSALICSSLYQHNTTPLTSTSVIDSIFQESRRVREEALRMKRDILYSKILMPLEPLPEEEKKLVEPPKPKVALPFEFS